VGAIFLFSTLDETKPVDVASVGQFEQVIYKNGKNYKIIET
jgi:hypothetical protein